ncbi:hypothetical protein [Klebsiella quasipneumoniae]|uniref:hypothetical protein n=1 Tax=Klebsiella quasipneumoniae TaxID=1463165 RepID=UPI001C962A82|nr:hypothetical protein [Klebsiella quasipneumoniae]MBY5246622.1 hypothetical protein [Klebsiella quasipneumoniae]
MKYEKKINKGQDSISVEITFIENVYRVHFLVLGRKNTTSAEKKEGIKKKRYIKSEEIFNLHELTDETLSVLPSPELKQALDSADVIISVIQG